MLTPAAGTENTAASEPLRGVPTVRRLKSYQADTGFTWAYYFEGYRAEAEPHPARTYVFTLQGGSRSPQRIFVVISELTLEDAAARTGSVVAPRESYALAKMHLFSVLDREDPPAPESRWELDVSAAVAIWEQLDL